MRTRSTVCSVLLLALVVARPVAAQTPLGTAFTYQGRLTDSGVPPTGAFDLQFRLFDAPTAGNPVGSTVTLPTVVTSGHFTVRLDFGASAFAGSARWLEIGVRPTGSPDPFTTLSPRQELTPVPDAVFSATAPWTGVTGKPAGFADGVDNDSGGDVTGVTAGTGLSGGGSSGDVSLAVNTAVIQSRVTGTCAPGSSIRVVNDVGTVACQPDTTGSDWGLAGNAGTNPATNFLGTTDNQPLVFRVNNLQGLRIEPAALSPNVVGGFSGNTATSGVLGIFIGGGGLYTDPNRVTDSWGVVAGGYGNRAGDDTGGTNERTYATVAGGSFNVASGQGSAVLGGTNNAASDFASTVAGGFLNLAGGAYSFAAGFQAKVRAGDSGTFVWSDAQGGNFQSTGINQFLIRAAGGVGINTNAPAGALDVNGSAVVRAPGTLSFGSATRQMLNLWSAAYGLGVQSGRLYFRTDEGFAWFRDGSHSDGTDDPGPGGALLMNLDDVGNLNVTGNLTKGGGSFKIDHPLDPANKYLSHSFVESPDMMNIYNGNVTTGGDGFATVELPEWFETLNRDFRYQLTVIGDGSWARARVFRKVAQNRFVIQTDAPRTEVSWQVTGIRKDAWADKHRIRVEEDKPHAERGRYLHPDAVFAGAGSSSR